MSLPRDGPNTWFQGPTSTRAGDGQHRTGKRVSATSEETRRCHSYFVRAISRTSSESGVSNATKFVNGLMSFTSSSLNKDAPTKDLRYTYLHRFLTRNDSITARAGYPGLVRLSANIVKVLTQRIRALETAHCSMMPRASSPVRELRDRSCGDSLLVKESKIPRESVIHSPV